MKPRRSLLAVLALLATCEALLVPRTAAAQEEAQTELGDGAAGGCVACTIVGSDYECKKSGGNGGSSCTLSNGGQSCSISGPCTAAAPVPIDGAANFSNLALLDDAGAATSFATVSSGGDGRQFRARCNGVVLARAYTSTAADRLRRETSLIQI